MIFADSKRLLWRMRWRVPWCALISQDYKMHLQCTVKIILVYLRASKTCNYRIKSVALKSLEYKIRTQSLNTIATFLFRFISFTYSFANMKLVSASVCEGHQCHCKDNGSFEQVLTAVVNVHLLFLLQIDASLECFVPARLQFGCTTSSCRDFRTGSG